MRLVNLAILHPEKKIRYNFLKTILSYAIKIFLKIYNIKMKSRRVVH